MLKYHRITEEEKYIVSNWKYNGDYSIYNSLPYEDQKKLGIGLANTKNNYFVFYDKDILVGYINLHEEKTKTFFGIAANPKYCGEGYGQRMTKMAIEIAQQMFPGKSLCLKVRVWNERAIQCYKRAGFQIDGDPIVQSTPVGEELFYYMNVK